MPQPAEAPRNVGKEEPEEPTYVTVDTEFGIWPYLLPPGVDETGYEPAIPEDDEEARAFEKMLDTPPTIATAVITGPRVRNYTVDGIHRGTQPSGQPGREVHTVTVPMLSKLLVVLREGDGTLGYYPFRKDGVPEELRQRVRLIPQVDLLSAPRSVVLENREPEQEWTAPTPSTALRAPGGTTRTKWQTGEPDARPDRPIEQPPASFNLFQEPPRPDQPKITGVAFPKPSATDKLR